ncbi:MAG: hypothetical protein IKB04_04040 [Clostridia bacterium]|nr:hypothetical protein [Clostridia bacterium]
MNKRLVMKNPHGNIVSCILSTEIDYKEQLHQVFALSTGQGISAELCTDTVVIRDVFHGETIAEFQVLSLEETTEPVSYDLTPAE